ncbi:MAG: oligosaccharide flippase family protein [Planctomycetota bacterium]
MTSTAKHRESLLQSQLALVGAQGLQIGLGFVLTVAAVRTLSDAAFGSFVFASAWMIMAARVVDAGLSPALIRDLVNKSESLWHRVFSIRTAFAVVLAVVTPLVFISNSDLAMGPKTRFAVSFGVAISIFALPLRSWHQRFAAQQRNRVSAWISLGAQCFQVTLALGALAYFGSATLPYLVGALASRELLNSIVAWGYGRRMANSEPGQAKIKVKAENLVVKSGKTGLLSLSLATVATALYFHVDVFMIEAWRGTDEVAGYGLAIRVLAPLLAAVHLATAPVLPFVVRANSKANRGRVLASAMIVVGFATAPLAAALCLGPAVADLLSGRAQHAAGDLLSILTVVPLAVVAGALASAALIAIGRTRDWAAVALVGLAINLSLNAWWIPEHGARGAAWATAITEAFVGASSAALAWFHLRSPQIEVASRRRFQPPWVALGILTLFIALATQLDGASKAGAVAIWILAAAAAAAWTFSPAAKGLRRRIESEGIDSSS